MLGKKGISVIVPVYNEEKIIEANSLKLAKFLECQDFDFEILLCNNGSTDKTLEKAKALAKKNKHITVASIDKKGLGLAIKKGFSTARFENIVFFPIDLSFNQSFIPEAKKILDNEKADIVIGSKGAKGSRVKRPRSRRIYSFFYDLLLNMFFGLGIKDTNGTLAFKKTKTKNALTQTKAENAFFSAEFLINAKRTGIKIIEIPVVVKDLRKNSKIAPRKDSLEMFKQIVSFRINGYRKN